MAIVDVAELVGVDVAVLVGDVVALVVREEVSVVVGVVVEELVAVVVWLDVPVVVGEEVCVVVGVVVAVVVAVDVTVVVGVVASQFWKPPLAHASVMELRVRAIAAHSVLSTSSEPNAQKASSAAMICPGAAGPRNSVTAAFRAIAPVSQEPPLTTKDESPERSSHSISGLSAGHASRISLRIWT